MFSAATKSDRLSVAQLAKQQCVDITTVRRWARRGTRGVRLRITHIGGRCFVTEADWVAFLDGLNREKGAASHA